MNVMKFSQNYPQEVQALIKCQIELWSQYPSASTEASTTQNLYTIHHLTASINSFGLESPILDQKTKAGKFLNFDFNEEAFRPKEHLVYDEIPSLSIRPNRNFIKYLSCAINQLSEEEKINVLFSLNFLSPLEFFLHFKFLYKLRYRIVWYLDNLKKDNLTKYFL